jgi:hypothetical protein
MVLINDCIRIPLIMVELDKLEEHLKMHMEIEKDMMFINDFNMIMTKNTHI